MTSPNGHANRLTDNLTAQQPPPLTAVVTTPTGTPFTAAEIRNVVAQLELPFDPRVIEWRVMNTSKNGQPRGQVIPYADQRAYTDRLNALFTPAGWTREYGVYTSANFERSKDKKIVAKVLVTCKLMIFGLGSHSATGEEWADDENAGTAAEAQAFKRACACFGLGRYLYYFTGEWVDLDERKRPKRIPTLPTWATPEGWLRGLRPQETAEPQSTSATDRPATNLKQDNGGGDRDGLVLEIEALQGKLGRGLYRGLLRTIARAWKPAAIREVNVLQEVLAHMQAGERGLQRLGAAVRVVGPDALKTVLGGLRLRSLDKVDSLATLKKIVLAVEQAAKAQR